MNLQSQKNLRSIFENTWLAVSKVTGDQIFEDLLTKYSEPHRHYHNLSHIEACLGELKNVKLSAESKLLIELAIWFHDVIYDSKAKDNELKSSEYFRTAALNAGVSIEIVNSVCKMIEATQKHQIPQDFDTVELRTFLDIDLSILGAGQDRFVQYDNQIKAEYSWVPEQVYSVERKKVLRHFLDREFLYFTPEFRNRYELQARKNIKSLLN